MKRYFFIPANNKRFIDKMNVIAADHFIFDLEDAIAEHEISASVENIVSIKADSRNFVRLRLDQQDDFEICASLINAGYKNFVVPKISTPERLIIVSSFIAERVSDFKLILLIESPLAVINVNELIKVKGVCGLGLGSHDYCNEMGMLHVPENFDWAAKHILNYAKAYRKEIIDIASMNISDKSLMKSEYEKTFSAGYDAKFFIHPAQLEVFNEMDFFSPEELKDALAIRDHVISIGGVDHFGVMTLNGHVVEKPHLERYRKILKRYNHDTF